MKIKTEADATGAFMALDLQVLDELYYHKDIHKVSYEEIEICKCIMQLLTQVLSKQTKLLIAQKFEKMIENWGGGR